MEMIFRQAPQGIIVCDSRGKITLVNTAARELMQKDTKTTLLKYAPGLRGELFDPRGRRILPEESPCMRALRGETTIDRECRVARFGNARDILFSAAPVICGDRVAAVIAIVTDNTKHKREQLSLRESAVSRERRRMAADLHDTFAQSLNAIVLLLEAAEVELPTNLEDAQQHFRRAHEVARNCLVEARHSMWSLSHDSLENDQLAPALSFLAKQLFAGTSVEVQLSLQDKSVAISPEVRREILRIAREALANVLKHAKATKVHVGLSYKQQDLQLRVQDDGRGFPGTSTASANGNYGLDNMRRRTERLGGKFAISSRPGRGTNVMASLPLPTKVLQMERRSSSPGAN